MTPLDRWEEAKTAAIAATVKADWHDGTPKHSAYLREEWETWLVAHDAAQEAFPGQHSSPDWPGLYDGTEVSRAHYEHVATSRAMIRLIQEAAE